MAKSTDKNIYELFNNMEIDLELYERYNVTEIEERRWLNYCKVIAKQAKKQYKGAIAACIVLLSITTVGVAPVLATVNPVMHSIADFMGIERDLEPYTTVIGQSITKKGVTITLNEVILDHEELIVSTTIQSEEKIEEGYADACTTIYSNGKRISDGSGGGSSQIDDYTIEEVMHHKLNVPLTGELDIRIVFSDIHVNQKTKSGKWVFEFQTNGEMLAKDTKEVLINHCFTLEDENKIYLEKYTNNNVGEKIYFSMDKKNYDYDMQLKGKDNLGNPVEFYLSSMNGKKGIFKLERFSSSSDEKATSYELTPYAVPFPEESGRLNNDFKKIGKSFTVYK